VPPTIKVPTLSDVEIEIEALREILSVAETEYETASKDTSASDRLIEIGNELNRMMPIVQALQNEATELRARPHPDAAFIAKTAKLEFDLQQAAGHSVEALSNLRAERLFGCTFKELPDDTASGIKAGLRAFKTFTTIWGVRFGQSANKTVTAAKERIGTLLADLDAIAELLSQKSSI
jgi:hypothetical protein